MPRFSSLASRLLLIGAVLLIAALASVGMTLRLTWRIDGGAAAVNEAGRLRMLLWEASARQPASDSLAQHALDRVQAGLDLLGHGDPARPLHVPWTTELREAHEDIRLAVGDLSVHAKTSNSQVRNEATAQLVRKIDGLVAGIEQQLIRDTALLHLLQLGMLMLAVLCAVLVFYVGYQYVINPLTQLRNALREVEAGHFETRLNTGPGDEFGQLIDGFNRMAARLRDLYAGLEQQVAAKTQRLEAQRQRIEILYEVSAFLAQANTVDEMTRGFIDRLTRVIKADAVALRWSDEASRRYVLLAEHGLPERFCHDEHSIEPGHCHCGSSNLSSRTRVIPIHEAEPVSAAGHRCATAGFATLVVVPVRLQHRVLAEINLFFRQHTTLSAEEREQLDALASHLGSALEGLRALALEREAAVSQERILLARELHDSIAQSLAFLKIQVHRIRQLLPAGLLPEQRNPLDELDEGLRESIADVRELLLHFRTRASHADLEQALQETRQKFMHQTGLPLDLKVSGAGIELPADHQLQVLHIVQEALSNIRKHANASRVLVSVERGARWKIRIHDDGCGFESAPSDHAAHVGLRIMNERAQRIGARIRVDSTVGSGTTVELAWSVLDASTPHLDEVTA